MYRTVVAATGVIFCMASQLVAAEDPPPNIVFFLVDDMGWQDTSVAFHTETTELNRRYVTPNMETLARQGMKFTQAYACALCSPTRVSLMTGMNAARHRVTNWTLRKDRGYEHGHSTLQAPRWNINGLSPVARVERTVHAVTLPTLLQRAGYRTIHVGKAHFGADDTPGEDPRNQGFDVNIAGHCADWHYPNTYGQAPYSSIRQGDWKLICHYGPRKAELFDLRDDIGEEHDLAEQQPEKVDELGPKLTAFLRESNAQMPIDKTSPFNTLFVTTLFLAIRRSD